MLHGRDRLMQSFERARLVAVDVVAELQPLGEPDEYVNLSPTTGPVPVMVPNSQRPADTSADPSTDEEPSAATDGVEDADVDVVVDEPVEVIEDLATPDEAEEHPEVDDVVDEPVGEQSPREEVAGEREPDAPRDDVVVDLFARLRADASLVAVESDDDPLDEPGDVDVDAVQGVDEVQDVDAESDDDSSVAGDESAEATPFDQRDADLTPLIVASAKKLKRVLADEQNEVLDALRRREPVRAVSDILPASAEHLARYRVVIVDDLVAAANAGASLVTPGRVARIKKADAANATAAGEAVLDEWLIVPLRERLERCVLDGDGDNAGITKRVRAVYREWKTQHIDEQLDDVIRAAHGHGVFVALEPGAAVAWAADPSHAVCADCDDNTLGGAVAAGDAFPTGHRFPPAHLGCRCILLPTDR